jgi:hypothetical protein
MGALIQYPHPNPKPGSNAIGSFKIGVSPIGTIPAFDPWQTLLNEYAETDELVRMIGEFNAAVDPTENLDNFYDTMWNLLTAVGYGLSIWGNIVGAPRTLPVTGTTGQPTFGFNESGNDWVGFGGGPFTQGAALGNNVTLTDAQYRPLVLAKCATNIWNGSIPKLNAILLALFQGRGSVYVRDGLNMSLTYVFNFALTNLDQAIINSSGVLPQPAGVVINISAP